MTGRLKLVGELDSKYTHVSYAAVMNNQKLTTRSRIVDSGASCDATPQKDELRDFRPSLPGEVLRCGGGDIPVLGYGSLTVRSVDELGKDVIVVLRGVAYVPELPLTVISLSRLEERGWKWEHWNGKAKRNGLTIRLTIKSKEKLYLIPPNHAEAVSGVINAAVKGPTGKMYGEESKKARNSARNTRKLISAWANSELWHARLGHPGPEAMEKLTEHTLGCKVKGPTTVQCDHCAFAKAVERPSRRPINAIPTQPFHTMRMDWFDLKKGWDGYQWDSRRARRVCLFQCVASRFAMAYTFEGQKGDEVLTVLKACLKRLERQHGYRVKVIRADMELLKTNATAKFLKDEAIEVAESTAETHAQNGGAEQLGRRIMEKARAMRLSARLPHDLWVEIVGAAVYLFNRTPTKGTDWKSPYEVFHKHSYEKNGIVGDPMPSLAHLKAYGCVCFVLIKGKKSSKHRRLWKLDPRAFRGYLVGYVSTSIWRVWVPAKRKVISVRDVSFKETEFFDSKKVLVPQQLMTSIDEAWGEAEVELTPAVREMEEIEADDIMLDEIAVSSALSDDDLPDESDLEGEMHSDEDSDSDDDIDGDLDADGCFGGAEEAYPTPPPSVMIAAAVQEEQTVTLPVDGAQFSQQLLQAFAVMGPGAVDGPRSTGVRQTTEPLYPVLMEPSWESTEIEPAVLDESIKQRSNRFWDFDQHRFHTPLQRAFVTGATLSRKTHRKDVAPAPANYKQAKQHRFWAHFDAAMRDHLDEHDRHGSWEVVPYQEGREHGERILGCQWVFTYKCDKHGNILKCKARLVVRGDQQEKTDLPTRATTLATTSLRVLLAIVAKFDLETTQLDAVNAFVHADLDEKVYMHLPPGVMRKGNACIQLKKALYGLRRSPLLWQKKWTAALSLLGFSEVPGEPCVMMKDGIVCFFFVDDIVFAYRKSDKQEVNQMVTNLKEEFRITEMGPVNWFLGMNVVRDRSKRKLWLSQRSYIEKLSARFLTTEELKKTEKSPMSTTEELLPRKGQEEAADRTKYQQMVGSLLFGAISTRPDIAFATNRLARFGQNPSVQHFVAAKRVIRYLYQTRFWSLEYGSESGTESLICASDSSFADNWIDRKSSQGFLMKLFGGPVAWRENKQDTVTTSTTEAEVLALSQTAKEAVYLARLLKGLSLRLPGPLTIDCDNRQSIKLLVEESTRLQTKLRHVDIHGLWIRQEVQRGHISVRWVSTTEMIADGLTKALGNEAHGNARQAMGLVNLEDRLKMIELMEEKKEQLMASKEDGDITVLSYEGRQQTEIALDRDDALTGQRQASLPQD